VSAWLAPALRRLRAQRNRTLLAAAGIAAAAVMIGTAVTVAYGLSTGFDRAAAGADLPDLIAHFDQQPRSAIAERVDRLANVASVSYRRELLDFDFEAKGHFTDKTEIQVVGGGRRGYRIDAGRDLSGAPGEVVVERGLADAWGLGVGDSLRVEDIGELRVVGISVSPDDVAYPLNAHPRVYLSQRWLAPYEGDPRDVNMVLLWARDRSQLGPLVSQARSLSFGLSDVTFSTRNGIQALIDQAAGIIIALLIALSVVAIAAAGVMLGATARADVQRRLQAIGIMRAVGVSRLGVVRRYGADALLVALPAALLGLAAGALAVAGPSDHLLEILNEDPPGSALLWPLAGCLAAIVALVCAATLWPAWRAAGRPPAEILRGSETRIAARRTRTSGGPFGLGLRLAAGRRLRTVATAAVIAAASGVVLLMLAMASFLQGLENDPGTLGRRYQLTVDAAPADTAMIAGVPGVSAAAPIYREQAESSFELGQPIQVTAFPGDLTRFESPPLAEGRQVASDDEAVVGVRLADALGLRPGGTLALQLEFGREAHFKVVGIVRALDSEGKIAYTRPRRLVAADPAIHSDVAVRLADPGDRSSVVHTLNDLGLRVESASGTGATRNKTFLGVLASVLRVVAGINLLICLYALIQALTVTAAERRQTIAVLRASGARRSTITLVMLGAAVAVIAIAIPVGIALERILLGPLVARLAADYATLPLGAGVGELAITIAAIATIAAAAAAWVARHAESEPIAASLRIE
jgi:ABC-type antimicrobial peptide transport system permease subunit